MIVTNSPSGGGAERAMSTLANSLHELGVDVTLVTVNDGLPDLITLNCEKVVLHRRHGAGVLFTVESALELRRLALKRKVSTVILNCDLPELLGVFLSGPTLLIVVEHTSKPFFNRRIMGWFIRILLSLRGARFAGVIQNSQVWPFGRKMDFYVKNPIDSDAILMHQSLDSEGRKEGQLVFIGRMSSEKNPLQFIEIVKNSGISASMFGDGSLLDRIRSLNLPNLNLNGHVLNPWMYISKNDIVIVPSLFEGDGLVVVEALVNNMPILLMDNPDLRRFGLSDVNYAKTTEQFINRIDDYRKGILDLKVSRSLRNEIINSRKPSNIAKDWVKEIQNLIT